MAHKILPLRMILMRTCLLLLWVAEKATSMEYDFGPRLIVTAENSTTSVIHPEYPLEIMTDTDGERFRERILFFDEFVFDFPSDSGLLQFMDLVKDSLPLEDRYTFYMDDMKTAESRFFRSFHFATFIERSTMTKYRRVNIFTDNMENAHSSRETRTIISSSLKGYSVNAAAFPFPPYSILNFETGDVSNVFFSESTFACKFLSLTNKS